MSIGPSERTKTEEVPVISRFSASAKKVVETYFAKPSHYLFYLLLTLGALALLIGKEPPVKFWILLGVIGLLNLINKPAEEKIIIEGRTKNSNGKRNSK